jgi:hypothetical protein
MEYKCNNKEYGVKKEPCGRTWNGNNWSKEADTEYTRNEKCPKCGGNDLTKIEEVLLDQDLGQ